jgi:hypothetical protein
MVLSQSGSKIFNGIALYSDALITTVTTSSNTVYKSLSFASQMQVSNPSNKIAAVALSADGTIMAGAMSNGKIFQSYNYTIPATSYPLPIIAYDSPISVYTGFYQSCPAPSTHMPYNSGFGCSFNSIQVSQITESTAWQASQPSVNKKASAGKWQFGGWAFCLDSNKFPTCDAQFKSEICDSGFFNAMLADKICSKTVSNPPYICTKGADLFSALSLAASTALSTMGIIVSLAVVVLGVVYGENYDALSTPSTADGTTQPGEKESAGNEDRADQIEDRQESTGQDGRSSTTSANDIPLQSNPGVELVYVQSKKTIAQTDVSSTSHRDQPPVFSSVRSVKTTRKQSVR